MEYLKVPETRLREKSGTSRKYNWCKKDSTTKQFEEGEIFNCIN